MSDVRALLRAKRQEARISHPLASYNASGQLKCIICGTLVKFASAWEGHLGSKAHRTLVARIKEEERLRDMTQMKEEVADTTQEEEEEIQQMDVEDEQAGHKRKVADSVSDETSTSKKPKLAVAGFPTDFFSDPSSAPVLGDHSDTDDEGREELAAPAKSLSAIDLEYEKFQKEVSRVSDFRETYERATVVAEPELAPEVPGGLPASAEDNSKAQEGKEDEKPELTEEQKQQQKENEEKELIMDRLMEEERAQEEADMKVQMMKNRLEAFKKQRETARAAKAAKKASW